MPRKKKAHEQCAEMVQDHQCTRNGLYLEDGKRWCHQHRPSLVRNKMKERMMRHDDDVRRIKERRHDEEVIAEQREIYLDGLLHIAAKGTNILGTKWTLSDAVREAEMQLKRGEKAAK